MSNIGKYQWAKQTSGILNMREKFELMLMIIQSEWKLACEKRRYRNKLLERADEITIPDSRLIRNVFQDLEILYSPTLQLHCIRTYCWAFLLARADKVHTDLEQLYLASMLHDLGLAPQHVHHAQCGCFAVYGAEQATQLLEKHDADKSLQHIVYEAISAHLNPWISPSDFHNVSIYVGQGAFLDVTGKRLFKIHTENKNTVLQAYPRTSFQTEILATMSQPHHKSTRAGLMQKAFIKMVKSNPLDI
ncbi:HD domain-containing protein [Neisseria canis]|uniref:Predicted HD superfamily hydrolase n=1 Tax=Neisseria canis TaxID=493 RepID=A0A448D6J1_9NEIS|nr:HD domain-containing protein [Neisseria canis]VEF00005.1 Predicted HD superfamily hydrolase [Neisseria canis]